GAKLDIVNLGAERDILDRQRIARKNIGFLAAEDRRTDLEPDRGQNVPLLAIEIGDQCDVRRAVRIVFDLRDLARDAALVTAKIDHAVKALVAAPAASDRDAAIAVAAADPFLRFEQ